MKIICRINKCPYPNLVSEIGRTRLEIATAMDYGEIAELLREHKVEK